MSMADTTITNKVAQMTKSFFIAVGMSVALFVYGYVLSTAWHDHSQHSGEEHEESGHSHSH